MAVLLKLRRIDQPGGVAERSRIASISAASAARARISFLPRRQIRLFDTPDLMSLSLRKYCETRRIEVELAFLTSIIAATLVTALVIDRNPEIASWLHRNCLALS